MKKPRSLMQIRRYIQTKYPTLDLGKGNGYYWFFSEDEKLGNAISSLNTSSVYVASLKQLSLEEWMQEAEDLMKKV